MAAHVSSKKQQRKADIMTNGINHGDLDAHITREPREGVPIEVLEEAAERAFRECARSHKEAIEIIQEAFLIEMRDAWEGAGGDRSDCPGFVELNDVADIVSSACEPKGKVKPWSETGIRKGIE